MIFISKAFEDFAGLAARYIAIRNAKIHKQNLLK
jgi:hypothetical protein